VTAYGVARRQAESGIRMALGAQPGSVVWLLLREVAAMLAIGMVLGLGASLAAGRLVAGLPHGMLDLTNRIWHSLTMPGDAQGRNMAPLAVPN
jgi:ABC-type antimicrobial peptide transport system permease subunit